MIRKILAYLVASVLSLTCIIAGYRVMISTINDSDWYLRWLGIFVLVLMVGASYLLFDLAKVFADDN